MTTGYICTSYEKTPIGKEAGKKAYEITLRVQEVDIEKKTSALFMNQVASRALKKVSQFLDN